MRTRDTEPPPPKRDLLDALDVDFDVTEVIESDPDAPVCAGDGCDKTPTVGRFCGRHAVRRKDLA